MQARRARRRRAGRNRATSQPHARPTPILQPADTENRYVARMDVRTAHALIRFGLGPSDGEAPPSDPMGWLASQLDAADPVLSQPAASTSDGFAALRQDRLDPVPEGQKRRARILWETESHAALRAMVQSTAPFRERLVWFWANHFAIDRRRANLHTIAVAYVREAIRPHVTGSFAAMLAAVMQHPAMLLYLDNAGSVGPDTPIGRKQHRGLNENLARECLELHTVTRAAGYTQADVTAFARLLTGWTVSLASDAPRFRFAADWHQPGPQTVMGQTFPDGQAGGLAALAWLGQHPATFHALAVKLVRHFVADVPAPGDVARVESVLRRTGGDLKAATLELLRLPAAWQPLSKLRTPFDYAIAVLRALGLPENNSPDPFGVMEVLGQPFMAPPLPIGWPDTGEAWADGELLLRRADWAMAVSGRLSGGDAMALAQATLGDLLTAQTRQTIMRAPSRREAVALLLSSPEFQRR